MTSYLKISEQLVDLVCLRDRNSLLSKFFSGFKPNTPPLTAGSSKVLQVIASRRSQPASPPASRCEALRAGGGLANYF